MIKAWELQEIKAHALYSRIACLRSNKHHASKPAAMGKVLPTRLVLEERKECDVIGEVEVMTAHDDGEVVSESEETRTRCGAWLKR